MITDVFSYKFYKSQLSNNLILQKLELNYTNLNFEELKGTLATPIREDFSFEDWWKFYQTEITSGLAELGINKKYFKKDIWCSVYTNNSELSVHDHGTDGIIGMHYVKFKQNIHPPTRFYDSANKELFLDFEVSEQDFILTPSEIFHSVSPNLSEDPRIVVVFKIIFDSQIETEIIDLDSNKLQSVIQTTLLPTI